MDFQIHEAIRLCNVSLDSTTVEWAINLELCDILSANPPIACHLNEHIGSAMRSASVRRASLALSLVEMLIKNLGITFLRHVDDVLCNAWESICVRKSSWRYSITRNVFKVTQQYGTSNEQSVQWQQVVIRARGLLQEAADSLLLHEGEARSLFGLYKKLRAQQIEFPPKTEANCALIRGGLQDEELPPASPTRREQPAPVTEEDGRTQSHASRPPAAARLPDSTPLSSTEVDELKRAVEELEGENPTEAHAHVCRRLRPRLVTLIQHHADSIENEMDELMLEAMMGLLSRLDTACEPFAPPPPEEPMPTNQEGNTAASVDVDYLVALMLQQQEIEGAGGYNPFGQITLPPHLRGFRIPQRMWQQGQGQLGMGQPHGRQGMAGGNMGQQQQRTYGQARAPPARTMHDTGFLIGTNPAMASIEGPTGGYGSSSNLGPRAQGSSSPSSPSFQSGPDPTLNPLDTSLLGNSAAPKKPKVWDRLKQLALDASSQYQKRGIGEARDVTDYTAMGDEGKGLMGTKRGSVQSQESLLGDDNDEENEADWEVVRTDKKTYWFNKRTLRSQWQAPKWAYRKTGQHGL